MSDMHETVEEGTRCDDHGLGSEGYPPDCGDAHGLAVLHEKLAGLVLPNVKVGNVVERVSPFPYKLSSVALCAWRPYGGTFAFVEHPELYGRPVGDHSHLSAHSVNLPHDLSLGDTANGRIAAHLCNLVHVHCHQASSGPHVGCSRGGLAACVPAADDNDVVVEICCFCHLAQK